MEPRPDLTECGQELENSSKWMAATLGQDDVREPLELDSVRK